MEHSNRTAMLAKIHIAKKDLRLDDDTYRAILARHGATGETPSSRDLTIAQMDAVLREFTGFGWQPKQPKAGRKPNPAKSRAAQMGKIEALLADKASRQGTPVSWNYAHAIARRVCKVELLDFCDAEMLGKVIAALSYDLRRHPEATQK